MSALRWPRSHHKRSLGAFAVVLVSILAVACGGNGDTGIESDEFFRPGVSTFQRAGDDQGADQATEDAADDQGQQPVPFEPADQADEPNITPDPPPAATGDEIELADDIVRRYLSAAYGYSLELVCGVFCNATSNALDRVAFLSDDRTSLINIEVLAVDPEAPPSFEELEAIWASRNVDNESFTIEVREETLLPADGISPALRFEWTIDRRAVGGFQERYQTLITVVGPIAYFINAGGISENYAATEPFLTQSLDSFLARQSPPGLPGLFTRWGFSLPYDVEAFSGEIGNRTPTPSFDSGVFVQQASSGQLEIVLIWDSIGQALFDPDTAIDDAIAPDGGTTVEEQARGDTTVAGEPARFVVADTVDLNGNATQVVVYAWYCGDSGRSFVLQSFNAEDRADDVDRTLSGFTCAAP